MTTLEKISVLDIPVWWWNSPKDFKSKVLELISSWRYDESPFFSDGTKVPFYPIMCATSSEWWILTQKDVEEALVPVYMKLARNAYLDARKREADHISYPEHLAWWLQRNLFSEDEVQRIRFDYWDTSDSYIKSYWLPNMISDHAHRLMYPRCRVIQKILDISWDVHECCSCC